MRLNYTRATDNGKLLFEDKQTNVFVRARWLNALFIGSLGIFLVGSIVPSIFHEPGQIQLGFVIFFLVTIQWFTTLIIFYRLEARGPLVIYQNGIFLDNDRWPIFPFKNMIKLEWGPNRQIVILTDKHQTLRLHFKTAGNADKAYQLIQQQMNLAEKSI